MKTKRATKRRSTVLLRAAVTDLLSGTASFATTLTAHLQSETPRRRALTQAVQKHVRSANGLLLRALTVLKARYAQRSDKRLHVAETVSLGERRFVALLTLDGQEFLVGGGTAGVSLLTRIEANESFTKRGAAESGESFR